MDKKHYESRHDRREERADHYDFPRAPEEDMGLNGVEKSSRHDGRDKDRKKSSRTEDKDHRSKDTEGGKDRIKDIKGKDKDHDRDRSREKERERDKEIEKTEGRRRNGIGAERWIKKEARIRIGTGKEQRIKNEKLIKVKKGLGKEMGKAKKTCKKTLSMMDGRMF